MASEVVASWLRSRMSRAKRRAVPRLRVPAKSPGQRVIPKPSIAQIVREREESAAERIYRIRKGDD